MTTAAGYRSHTYVQRVLRGEAGAVGGFRVSPKAVRSQVMMAAGRRMGRRAVSGTSLSSDPAQVALHQTRSKEGSDKTRSGGIR